MNERGLKLLLLPGMDGTGDLFAAFKKLLPGWIVPCVVSYPLDLKLPYDALLPLVKRATPHNEPFAILAESFSTHLAVRIAAEAPEGLRALIICAGFVSPPRHGSMRAIASIFGPALFAFGLPASVCRKLLVGKAASKQLVEDVRSIVSRVSPRVMAQRLRFVLSCDSKLELMSVSVPLLYIAGSQDKLVREESFEEIKEAKPQARLVRIQSPHFILQTHPEESASAVVAFLQTISN